MNAALAPARQTGADTSIIRERDSELLASVGQTKADFTVLQCVCVNPSLTIKELKNKMPDVESVDKTVYSLTERKWLICKHSLYNLTIFGWIYLSAAKDLLFPLG